MGSNHTVSIRVNSTALIGRLEWTVTASLRQCPSLTRCVGANLGMYSTGTSVLSKPMKQTFPSPPFHPSFLSPSPSPLFSAHSNPFSSPYTRVCERSGAAKFPAHRSAPFTGVPLTAPFPLRRPPATAPLIWLSDSLRSRSAPQQSRILGCGG